MRTLFLYTAIVFVLLTMSCDISFANSDKDGQKYLLPDESILSHDVDLQFLEYTYKLRTVFSRGYRKEVLFRMICLPSFQSEWLVEIETYTPRLKNRGKEYHVLLIKPEKQISSTIPLRNSDFLEADDFRQIPLNYYEENIDQDTAKILANIWSEMINSAGLPQEERRLGFDGVLYYFSTTVEEKGLKGGLVWSPDKDTNTGMLAELGTLLADYAQAEPDKREEILSSIKAKAEELQNRLKADDVNAE